MWRIPLLLFYLYSGEAIIAQSTFNDRGIPEVKAIFDKYRMTGTMIILYQQKNEYFGYNPANWDTGYLPASTFKIVNSLIGLETGVIDTNYVFRWDGEKRRLPQWEKDLALGEAFRVSCVPCYQELARKIGSEQMNNWLEKLDYGHMVVTPQTIDLFWLEGESRITPREQVQFLEKLFEEKLPLKQSVMQSVMEIMLIEDTTGFRVSGKTGWAIRNGNNYGWFVGFLQTEGHVYFVATLVQPKDEQKIDDFAAARKWITMDVFRLLGLIHT